MEHVINAKLRNQAFWKFFFFFLLTILIIVTAVYFDFRVPLKENAMLRERIDGYENQMYNQQQFIAGTETVTNLIDNMYESRQYNALRDRQIADELTKLQPQRGNEDSSIYAVTNKDVYILLSKYYNLNNEYLKNGVENVKKLKEELDKCRSDLTGEARDADVLQNSANSN